MSFTCDLEKLFSIDFANAIPVALGGALPDNRWNQEVAAFANFGHVIRDTREDSFAQFFGTGALTGSSPINAVHAVRIPKGTVIYEGPVGYQGGPYLGGQNQMQIFVQEPWTIPGVTPVSSTPLR